MDCRIPETSFIYVVGRDRSGGNIVAIIGADLSNGVAGDIVGVSFGGLSVATIVSFTSTTIVVNAPAFAASGPVRIVTVSTSFGVGNFTDAYLVNNIGSVSSVAPLSGARAGGSTVTITGTNLGSGDVTSFRWQEQLSPDISQTSTSIVVVSGAAASNTGHCVATVNVIVPRSRLATLYPLLPDPIVSSAQLATGPRVGGNRV